ncbi:sugar phosphate isomerase/epimerase family protein [Novosphingobium sp. Leaf2]|uniref:sugar phosphate isomerase/epimerase family protein n=1 Tax=Novosphingobium sp. Leaf2 TaxID=1735670 RepID=UPI0006F4D089|nr:sugar phosphate isomerase/epimerase [Novosphingobium sp. Leaf2]KQM22248.1 sugar phosphate isomerase [Novosphingobium sp. Leaf2]
MPHPFGIDLLTVMGLGPVEHVTLAADLGCSAVSMGLERLPDRYNPHGYAHWSLRENAQLRRDLKAVLAERKVALCLGSGLRVRPDGDAETAQTASDMDLFAELGALRVAASDHGAERDRAVAQLAGLADMAAARGMDFSIEFSPVLTIRSLAEAITAVQQIGEGKASVVIDALHFFRSGGSVRQIALLDPALIGHVQLADGPRRAEGDYLTEAMTERMIPGQGELPLREFVDALPRGVILDLTVPLASAARGGRMPGAYVGEVVKRTRDFLA